MASSESSHLTPTRVLRSSPPVSPVSPAAEACGSGRLLIESGARAMRAATGRGAKRGQGATLRSPGAPGPRVIDETSVIDRDGGADAR